MKLFATILVLAVVCLECLGEATINFNNRVTGAGGVVAPIYGPEPGDPFLIKRGNATTNGGTQTYSGPLLLGTNYSAALFGGALGTSPADLALISTVVFRTSASFAGFIQPPQLVPIVPGVRRGEQATLQVKAWDNLGGALNWEQALALSNVVAGASAVFTSVPLTEPPFPPVNLIGLQSFNLTRIARTDPPSIFMPPQDQLILAGSNVVFSVYAFGLANSYQWLFNGVAIPGANRASLVISNTQVVNAGQYRVVITNQFGAVTSPTATLTVHYLLEIVASSNGSVLVEPNAVTYPSGSVVKLTAIPEDGYAFTGWSGDASGNANPLTVTMNEHKRIGAGFLSPPRILHSPEPQTVLGGRDVQFSVDANGGNLSYQWLFDGTVIPGANQQSLNISNAQPLNAGRYRAVVTNLLGSATSTVATLTVRFSLTVGTLGEGTVSFSPFLPNYAPGSVVSLTATPAPGLFLSGWSGDASGSANPLTVVMNTNKTIYAVFGGPPTSLTTQVIGSGTVARNPDKPLYEFGELVTLTAAPGRWYTFVRWNDGFTNNPRTVTIRSVNVYTAFFAPTTTVETLTFSNVSRVAPVGMPAVFVDGVFIVTNAITRFGSARISLFSSFSNRTMLLTLDGSTPDFDSLFYEGPIVRRRSAVIRAIAYDSTFTNSWESDPIALTIIPTYTLKTETAGGGAILSSPSSGSYASNTLVKLTALPASGWTFLQWQGDAVGANPTNTVVMTADKSVRAIFGTTISSAVIGSGTVLPNPAATYYPYGTKIRLNAVPASKHSFAFWANAASSSDNPLDYLVTTPNPLFRAAFTALSAGQHSLVIIPDGGGQVSLSPQANRYSIGTPVTLTATPDPGQSFLGWSGDASGTNTQLLITMNQSKIIYANFTSRPRLSASKSVGVSNDGVLQLLVTGELNERIEVESSTNLMTWMPLMTVTNRFGTTQLNETIGTNGGQRFYRARTAPPASSP